MALKQYDYNKLAKYYDFIEPKSAGGYDAINNFLNKIFKKNKVRTVLDLTCGTGAQSIALAKRGYKVTASDLSKAMLAIAKKKAKNRKLKIKFNLGDMRKVQLGKFDAAISIFNAIAHLSKKDFEKAVRNIGKNLKTGGLFIFDIFNLDFMKAGGFIKHKFIDIAMQDERTKFVRFSDNKLDAKKGIMHINSKLHVQKGISKLEVYKEKWDAQIYSSAGLKKLLEKNGFKVLKFYDGSGKKLSKKNSLTVFTVARKR